MLLAGALTLGLLVLPVVIIAGREAIRAVPPSIREGSLALGATQWRRSGARSCRPPSGHRHGRDPRPVTRHRRDGAADRGRRGGLRGLQPRGPLDAFTALPIQIFDWISRPQAEFQVLAAAGIVVLLVLLLLMNFAAITLRNRYERKW